MESDTPTTRSDATSLARSTRRDATRALRRFRQQQWILRVNGGDPRFRDLLTTTNSLTALIEEATAPTALLDDIRDLLGRLEMCQARVEQFDAFPDLATSLRHLVTSVRKKPRADVVIERLGFGGEPPLRLAAVGRRHGITRERVRQLEAQFRNSVTGPVYLPELERVLAEFETRDAVDEDEVLARTGLAFAGLLSAAALCGYETSLRLSTSLGGGGSTYLDAPTEQELVARVIGSIPRRWQFFPTSAVLAAWGRDEATAALFDAISRYAKPLGDNWWSLNGTGPHSHVDDLLARMVALPGSISAERLQEGLVRRSRRKGRAPVPPPRVVHEFCRTHPAFEVTDGTVRNRRPVDWRIGECETTRTVVETILGAPGRVLDQTNLERTCCEVRGLSRMTFHTRLAFSPFLEIAAPRVWAARGVDPDPAVVEALAAFH